MKHLIPTLGFLCLVSVAAGQTVTIDSVSPLKVCAGKFITVHYSSKGKFDSLNVFAVLIADANGLYTNFPGFGESSASSGSIEFIADPPGKHRLVIKSSHPAIISSDSSALIEVFANPAPAPEPIIQKTNYFGFTGFIGDTIQFIDTASESAGSTSLWSFGQDGNVVKFINNSSPLVTYPSAGLKTATLSVANTGGCETVATVPLNIINCNPVIPASAHIVTGTEKNGNFRNIWIKAGGTYSSDTVHTIFVEPGGTLNLEDYSGGLFYLKPGSSINIPILGHFTPATAVLDRGMTINVMNKIRVDTIYCNDLQFDYSQVGGNDVVAENNPLQIICTLKNLHISSEGAEIALSLTNLLGVPVISKKDRDMLDLDLSILENGVYIAIIESGKKREMRKIIVMH